MDDDVITFRFTDNGIFDRLPYCDLDGDGVPDGNGHWTGGERSLNRTGTVIEPVWKSGTVTERLSSDNRYLILIQDISMYFLWYLISKLIDLCYKKVTIMQQIRLTSSKTLAEYVRQQTITPWNTKSHWQKSLTPWPGWAKCRVLCMEYIGVYVVQQHDVM